MQPLLFVAAARLQDIQVNQLLQQLGNVVPGDSEPVTTRCMRAAITPERVQQVQQASTAEVAQQISSLTMRMALHMQLEHSVAASLSTTLE